MPWSPGPRRGRLGRPAAIRRSGPRCGGCCCRTARRRPGRAPPADSAARGTGASGCSSWRQPAACCGSGVSSFSPQLALPTAIFRLQFRAVSDQVTPSDLVHLFWAALCGYRPHSFGLVRRAGLVAAGCSARVAAVGGRRGGSCGSVCGNPPVGFVLLQLYVINKLTLPRTTISSTDASSMQSRTAS